MNTNEQYDQVIARCRELYIYKMKDYGPSWRVLRPQSVTDQILIKAKRIRTLEETGQSRIDEDVWSEFMGIINYGVIGLIQLDHDRTTCIDMTADEALALYDKHIAATKRLMTDKNTDYAEAWRDMRVSSYTDIILTKVQRVKAIEGNGGATVVSEGIDANYADMINYAVFALIKHDEQEQQ